MRRRTTSEDQMSGSQGHLRGNLQVFALKIFVQLTVSFSKDFFSQRAVN